MKKLFNWPHKKWRKVWRLYQFPNELLDGGLRVNIGDCFLRESCRFLGRPLGENLCVLFGGYMIGYLYARLVQRFKIIDVVPGDTCTYEIKIFKSGVEGPGVPADINRGKG